MDAALTVCLDNLERTSKCLCDLHACLSPVVRGIRTYDLHLKEFLGGKNTGAFEDAIKAAGCLLHAFLKEFDGSKAMMDNLGSYNADSLCAGWFGNALSNTITWSQFASASTKPFCEIIEKAIRRLSYCGMNKFIASTDDVDLKTLSNSFASIDFAFGQIVLAHQQLTGVYTALKQTKVEQEGFDNPVYAAFVRFIVPACRRVIVEILNPGQTITSLIATASEFDSIIAYESNLAGLDSSARLLLMDLLSSRIFFKGTVAPVTLPAGSQLMLQRLMVASVSMIETSEYFEGVLRSSVHPVLFKGESRIYGEYRTIRLVLTLLGRTSSIAENNVRTAVRLVMESGLSDFFSEAAKLSEFKETGDALRIVSCAAACGLWLSFKRSLADARTPTTHNFQVSLHPSSVASTATSSKSPSPLDDKGKVVMSSAECWADSVFC